MRVVLKHEGGISFRAKVRGHEFMLDTPRDRHGEDRGPTPKEFLLAAIAGCSGMDVASILGKRKVAFKSLEVSAEGEPGDRQPKVFHELNLIFALTGTDLPLDPVIEAVDQSLTLYCGVSANVSGVTAIFYTILINGETMYRGQACFDLSPQDTSGTEF